MWHVCVGAVVGVRGWHGAVVGGCEVCEQCRVVVERCGAVVHTMYRRGPSVADLYRHSVNESTRSIIDRPWNTDACGTSSVCPRATASRMTKVEIIAPSERTSILFQILWRYRRAPLERTSVIYTSQQRQPIRLIRAALATLAHLLTQLGCHPPQHGNHYPVERAVGISIGGGH